MFPLQKGHSDSLISSPVSGQVMALSALSQHADFGEQRFAAGSQQEREPLDALTMAIAGAATANGRPRPVSKRRDFDMRTPNGRT